MCCFKQKILLFLSTTTSKVLQKYLVIVAVKLQRKIKIIKNTNCNITFQNKIYLFDRWLYLSNNSGRKFTYIFFTVSDCLVIEEVESTPLNSHEAITFQVVSIGWEPLGI